MKTSTGVDVDEAQDGLSKAIKKIKCVIHQQNYIKKKNTTDIDLQHGQNNPDTAALASLLNYPSLSALLNENASQTENTYSERNKKIEVIVESIEEEGETDWNAELYESNVLPEACADYETETYTNEEYLDKSVENTVDYALTRKETLSATGLELESDDNDEDVDEYALKEIELQKKYVQVTQSVATTSASFASPVMNTQKRKSNAKDISGKVSVKSGVGKLFGARHPKL